LWYGDSEHSRENIYFGVTENIFSNSNFRSCYNVCGIIPVAEIKFILIVTFSSLVRNTHINFSRILYFTSIFGGCYATTAWRVLRLRMEGSPPGTEDSYEYIE
jgi:hypothetical protein